MPIDINAVVRDLLQVASVAVKPGMPEITEDQAKAIVPALLSIIDGAMPPELQAQDRRIVAAREVARLLE